MLKSMHGGNTADNSQDKCTNKSPSLILITCRIYFNMEKKRYRDINSNLRPGLLLTYLHQLLPGLSHRNYPLHLLKDKNNYVYIKSFHKIIYM